MTVPALPGIVTPPSPIGNRRTLSANNQSGSPGSGNIDALTPMPGTKRHHYVPKLLMRRFSTSPQARNPILWKLEKGSGKPSKTAIDGEAVVGHYYRVRGSGA